MFVPSDGSPSQATGQVNRDVPSPLALATEIAPLSCRPTVTEFPGDRDNVPASACGGPLTNGTTNPAPLDGLTATFVDVALQELAAQIQRDRRSVAVVQEDLMDHFLEAGSHTSRLHLLPGGSRADDISRALDWCGRLAGNGRRPVLVVTDAYVERHIGQFREKLCQASLPVRFIIIPVTAAGVASGIIPSGPRSGSLLAFLRLLPEMVIVVPKDGWELRQVLRFAADYAGPVVVPVPRGPLPACLFPDFAEDFEFGKAEVLEDGDDLTLLALGSLVAPAVKASEILSAQGISAAVVNARFVEPLDRTLIRELAGRTRGLVTLEEESAAGGFGTAVLELLADSGVATPVTVSGAIGIECGGDGEEALVSQIVRRAVELVDRTNGTDLPARPPEKKRRRAPAGAGVDRFGFSIESLQREQELINARQLSAEIEEWAALYALVGDRQEFLWKWSEQGAELTTLPCVPSEQLTHVCRTKVLLIMLCVLLDDVADQCGREPFLELLLKIVDGQPLPNLPESTDAERRYADVTRRLTEIYLARVASYPCFDTYERLLRYDQFQYFNTMRYSQMLNRNLWLLNPIEHDLYQPHNMDMMSFSTIDLMCAPDFPVEELGRLREAVWHLQCMARVGNLLSTWRREIKQQDYTSGVFARAVVEGDLSVRQLRPENFREIETAIVEGGHERYYFRRWKYHRDCFVARARYVRTMDLTRLLEGSDRFFLMHLGGRGLI